MEDKKLYKKAELFWKLGGGLYYSGTKSPHCYECRLRGWACRNDILQHRQIFLEAEVNNHWHIVGYGINFGIPNSYMKNGKEILTTSVCIEWMDKE